MRHHAQEIIRFIRQLVSIPSQNGIDSEQAVARLVFDKLSSFDFKPKFVGGSSDHPSILCEIHKNPSGKVIWLEAPLDTVPAGDLSHWDHPPFGGKIVGDKMYGRGVADCKGGIALFSHLAKDLARDSNFNGSLFLSFDSNGQGGDFTGMEETLKCAPKADVCILGYQNYHEIMIGARGWMRLKLTTKGKEAHTGSRKGAGINAVHAMSKAVVALSSLGIGNKKEPFFEFGSSLHVSTIKGGTAVNIVPDRCEAEIDIRLVPSQTKEEILERIELLLQNLKNKGRLQEYSIDVLQYHPAFLTDPKEPIVHILHRNIRKITERSVPLTASGGGCVGNAMQKLGIPIIKAFGCDSGRFNLPNEWLNVATIPAVFEVYKKTLIEYTKLT